MRPTIVFGELLFAILINVILNIIVEESDRVT